MAKSKFFRVFVEGATVSDGRKITGEMIDQIVDTFNVATYQPRINCEHIKGYSPEPPFNAYGDVTAVKSQVDPLVIDGKTVQCKALYAQLEPNPQLIAINKAGQKKFTSVELTPSYASTGKVGIVGLAVTDNPASLGTEALSFSAFKPMWDARKTAPDNFFTAADPEGFLLELEADDQAGIFSKITAAITAGFASIAPKKEEPKPQDPPTPSNDNDMTAFSKVVGDTIAAALKPVVEAQDQRFASLQGELTGLKTKLETTQNPQTSFSRSLATGGNQHLTDC